ncbi:MAG: DUF4058 family protein [Tepidisphaerales bacterium]
MKSPFSGMDPYLEMWWRDVHQRLCIYSCDQIQARLGGDLLARVDERLVVETDSYGRDIKPDAFVLERDPGWESSVAPAGGVAVAEPLLLRIAPEPVRQGFIQIIDARDGGRVIAVIEFLSPSNKIPGDGLKKYLQNQTECHKAGVNLVEIDLVRAGERHTLAGLSGSSQLSTTYQVCAYRACREERCELYPVELQSRLPAIRIPLRPTDRDVVLDLQALIDQAYLNGRYGQDIDYRRPCDPPLAGEDGAWADGLLKAAGRS